MSALPRRCLALGLYLAAACLAAGALARPAPRPRIPVTGKASPNLASFDRLLIKFLTSNKQVPGAALAVSHNGKVVYSRGFGYADKARKVPVQPNARFRIASVTKPLTAVAILQLVEHGKLKLDSKVFDVLKLKAPKNGFDARWKQITIRHLLYHRGGFDRDKSGDPMFMSPTIVQKVGGKPPARPNQIIQFMLRRKLDFNPGSREVYSNFGYCLLGQVIAHLGGGNYPNYVKSHVLRPLGITGMAEGHTLNPQAHEVHYYAPGTGTAVMGPHLGKPVPLPYGAWCLESMAAHGGWIASAADLVRFACAFDNPARCNVLRPASIKTMFSTDPSNKGKPSFYASGWMVRPVGNKANTWHNGSLDGTSTLLVRRSDGLNWAILFNTREQVAGQEPADWMDSPLHAAADAVKKWP
jgi:N-acyl-D-amino-acid deacylase